MTNSIKKLTGIAIVGVIALCLTSGAAFAASGTNYKTTGQHVSPTVSTPVPGSFNAADMVTASGMSRVTTLNYQTCGQYALQN